MKTSFAKNIIKKIGQKPYFVNSSGDAVKFSLKHKEIISLNMMSPPGQADINMIKVNEMIESMRATPKYNMFKNIIIAGLFKDTLYLVDGQHRVEMMKRVDNISYNYDFIVYDIQNDVDMFTLFKEINLDSYKNSAYVSLPQEKATLANEVHDYFAKKPFATTTNQKSKLYTSRAFVNCLINSGYLEEFTHISEIISDMESKHADFIIQIDLSKLYVEERDCIEFIMPMKNVNFLDYLVNPFVEPVYNGKGKAAKGTISKNLSLALKRAVWDKHVGMKEGLTRCPVCNINTIYQSSFHGGHIIAQSKGGTDTVDNLKPICQSCNSSMGTTNMDDFIRKIRP